MLPKVKRKDGIRKETQVKFAGYNHTKNAVNGEIYDMHNMVSDDYPLLTSRNPRKQFALVTTEITGVYIHDGIFYTYANAFHEIGEYETYINLTTFSEGEKTFGSFGDYVIVLPDKKYYNKKTKILYDIEKTVTVGCSIGDGTYAGVEAASNTIRSAVPLDFRVGDAVRISGSSNAENNKTIVIREMSADKKELRFYENSFVNTPQERITISREMPDMDFICEHENRLWGCKGNEIYCSKLGDILNWNVFDDLSTSSFATKVGSAGDFTGCISYQGHVLFFKEECIYRLYGNKPSNYEVIMSAVVGVKKGEARSIAVAGEQVFYLSRAGIMSYSGGSPYNVSGPLGMHNFSGSQAGSDGRKYYISMYDEAEGYNMYVFDTQYGVWHREKGFKALAIGWNRGVYYCDIDGWLLLDSEGSSAENNAGNPCSMVEFGDFTFGGANQTGVSKLQLRLETERNCTVRVSVMFDSSGNWEHVADVCGFDSKSLKGSHYLPIIPRRCDHFRVKLEANGKWTLHSLTKEVYSGSELY